MIDLLHFELSISCKRCERRTQTKQPTRRKPSKQCGGRKKKRKRWTPLFALATLSHPPASCDYNFNVSHTCAPVRSRIPGNRHRLFSRPLWRNSALSKLFGSLGRWLNTLPPRYNRSISSVLCFNCGFLILKLWNKHFHELYLMSENFLFT